MRTELNENEKKRIYLNFAPLSVDARMKIYNRALGIIHGDEPRRAAMAKLIAREMLNIDEEFSR